MLSRTMKKSLDAADEDEQQQQQHQPIEVKQNSSKCRDIRTVSLRKDPMAGFGMAISEDRVGRLIIRGLNYNGVAFRDGRIGVGDEILAVNGLFVREYEYDKIMQYLHSSSGAVEFQLLPAATSARRANRDSDLLLEQLAAIQPTTSTSKTTTLNEQVNNDQAAFAEEHEALDPTQCAIQAGKETTIEVALHQLDIGLTIAGGRRRGQMPVK